MLIKLRHVLSNSFSMCPQFIASLILHYQSRPGQALFRLNADGDPHGSPHSWRVVLTHVDARHLHRKTASTGARTRTAQRSPSTLEQRTGTLAVLDSLQCPTAASCPSLIWPVSMLTGVELRSGILPMTTTSILFLSVKTKVRWFPDKYLNHSSKSIMEISQFNQIMVEFDLILFYI